MPKTILITGASSGIGKATSKFFQQKGWNVIASMRSPNEEQELTGLDNVLVTRLDVEDHGSIASAVEAGIGRFGRIDVLLNNAGYGSYGVLEATPLAKIRRQLEVNVVGLLATVQAVLPHFRAAKAGIVVNISSIGGKMAFPLGTLYQASKFAVEGLSEAMSFELGAIGVKVKIIEPGNIKTNFSGSSFDFSNDTSLVEYQGVVGKLMSGMEPTSKLGSPPELVADVIYQAVTDDTDQLRYTAGPDAKQIIDRRKALDDSEFLAGVRAQFGL